LLAQYTDWIFPLYELPFTGGITGTFAAGRIGARSNPSSRVMARLAGHRMIHVFTAIIRIILAIQIGS